MPTLQIYDKLLSFPLFQGMSRDDLEIIAGHTRFGFLRFQEGKYIVRQGDNCTQLYLLIKGGVQVESWSEDASYAVEETITAPAILQVEAIAGYYQRYTHNFKALTDTNFLTIDKEEVFRLTEDFLLFRLNLMNFYATMTQKQIQQLWRRAPKDLRERIGRFFLQHCVYPAGPKTFRILMERLGEEMNDSRLNVSRALNQMKREGLVELYRGRVVIPQLERLMM